MIAHEYFHNWTGDRITCRDWFQLSLKEGLNVFRTQLVTMHQGIAAVQPGPCRRGRGWPQLPEAAGAVRQP